MNKSMRVLQLFFKMGVSERKEEVCYFEEYLMRAKGKKTEKREINLPRGRPGCVHPGASSVIMLSKRKLESASSSSSASASKMRKVDSVSSSTLSLQTPSVSAVNTRIKVYVRVRPFNNREVNLGQKSVINIADERALVFDPEEPDEEFYFHGVIQRRRDVNKKIKKNIYFDFDKVFNQESTNFEVFEATTKNIVSSIFDGFNCSVFAYGATGAGKTFTMLGSQDSPGITYLTIVELLQNIEAQREKFKITLGASYIEVYNEIVRDLLHPGGQPLHLREEGGIVVVSGLKVEAISDSQQLFTLLENGNRQRSQHPTDTNAESSRSHAIFQVHVRLQDKVSNQVKISKLSMIDLAGSERGSATGYCGARFKEGSNINKSLLALGNCINALADGLKHIPFRDSKLTRILKDSLGGNCQTMMIANVSPSSGSYDDTYNTLKYATRAKTITTKASRNVLSDKLSIPQYKRIIQDLQEKLQKSQVEGPDVSEWSHKVESVMEELMKVLVEYMTLESQLKLTEWRLKRKRNEHSLLDPSSQYSTRIIASIRQLNARCQSIRRRMKEYLPSIEAARIERGKLDEIINNSKSKIIYQAILNSWENKVSAEIYRISLKHSTMMNKLLTKHEESYVKSKDIIVPFLNECYNLLKGYNHTTTSMAEKFENCEKSLSIVNEVTWDDEDVDGEEPANLRSNYFFLLSSPGSSILAEEEAKEIEESENYIKNKLPNIEKSAPLRVIQTPPHVNGKVKILKAGENGSRTRLTFKENVKITSTSSIKKPRAVTKSTSLIDLREEPNPPLNSTFKVLDPMKITSIKKTPIRVHPYRACPTPFKKKAEAT